MARYNIYKIKDGQAKKLRSSLVKDRNYSPIYSFESGNYKVNTYFTGPDDTEIWWLEQYTEFFGEHKSKKNQIYSGALIAVNKINEKIAYVIPLGKTHFYIQDYIEYNFGLELAERIADDRQTKMKSLKNFGGKTSKALVSYVSGSDLLFSSGESAEYLKLKAKVSDLWGNSFLHFGTSVQFNSIDFEPDKLGVLLENIDKAIRCERNFTLPFMKLIKDKALLDNLQNNLSSKILKKSNEVGLLDYEIYGTNFVFSQETHIRLKYGKMYSEPISNLTIESIANFIKDNSIDLRENWQDFKAQMLIDGQSKFTIPLIKLIEYCSDDNVFLYRGEWFIFNESFIDNLHSVLSKIKVDKFSLAFFENEFTKWREKNKEKLRYRERFILEKINEEYKYR